MNPKRALPGLFACLAAVVLSHPVHAYEIDLQQGYGVALLGDPINQTGTRRTASSPPVEIRVNLLRVDDTNLDSVTDSSSVLPSADLSRLSTLTDSAARYWEQVPSSFITARLVGSAQTSTYVNLRPYILVTLGSVPASVGGAAWGTDYQGQYLPLGIIINIDYFRQAADSVILPLIVHEVGHSLALEHSSCDRRLTDSGRFAYTDSLGAFMSYGDANGRASLHSDDVGGISQAYPDLSFSTDFGSISGQLVDSSGQSIFGGNVFAVDATNHAVVARISGLTNFMSLSSRHGQFRLSGLPPGTYTLVAASVTDSTYRIGFRPALPFDSYYRTDFAPAIRSAVVVEGGRDTSVGDLVAGTETQPEGELVSWQAVAGASQYSVSIYSYAEGRWILSGQVTAATSIRVVLAAGRYWLDVRAFVSGSWSLAEARILRVGDAQTRPPTISVSSDVQGVSGQALSIPYSAADPYGGPVSVRAEGMPSGMVLYSNQLYWGSPVTGSYTIRLVATNEIGVSSSADVRLTVRDPSLSPLTLTWTGRANDDSYQVSLYSYRQGRWVVRTRVRGATTWSGEFTDGRYYLMVERRYRTTFQYRGRTYTRWQWGVVGSRTFDLSGPTTITFP